MSNITPQSEASVIKTLVDRDISVNTWSVTEKLTYLNEVINHVATALEAIKMTLDDDLNDTLRSIGEPRPEECISDILLLYGGDDE